MTEAQEFELQCTSMPSVTIYSDGSFKPALGTGGYGTIMTCNGYTRFFYGGFVGQSNNAMELLGAIAALRVLNCPCRVTIISDSKYVVDGVNSWMHHWAANDWRKSDNGRVSNEELWRELYMYSQHHLLSAVWIKGHSSSLSNSTCDNLASIAAYKVCNVPVPLRLMTRV